MVCHEHVLCFERKLLDGLEGFQGLSLDVARYLTVVTDRVNLHYRLRADVEDDIRYKQLIPYVIIIQNGMLLSYSRGKGGGENRLHGLRSIGVGGHIASEDATLFSKDALGYYEGMWRELREEVDIDNPLREAAVALINDDSNSVGAVHFGVVHIVEVSGQSAAGGRKGIVAPEFIDVATAKKNIASYESWSRLCIEKFDVLMERIQDGSLSFLGRL